VTAFAAKLRTLLFAFPHFRNEDGNASMNTWSLYLISRWKQHPMTEGNSFTMNCSRRFGIEGESRRFGIENKGYLLLFGIAPKSNKKV
jgi:hypothetical protein